MQPPVVVVPPQPPIMPEIQPPELGWCHLYDWFLSSDSLTLEQEKFLHESNGDCAITEEEFEYWGYSGTFVQFDSNGDGMLDFEEFDNYITMTTVTGDNFNGPQGGNMPPPPPPPPGSVSGAPDHYGPQGGNIPPPLPPPSPPGGVSGAPPPPPPPPPSPGAVAEALESFNFNDLDNDGKINQEEFWSSTDKNLTDFDNNGDGMLDYEEFLPWFEDEYDYDYTYGEYGDSVNEGIGGAGNVSNCENYDWYNQNRTRAQETFVLLSGDCQISEMEYDYHRSMDKSFTDFDIDGDGMLDYNEFITWAVEEWFNIIDADSDGKINQAEFSSFSENNFQDFDLNGDGGLDFNEFVPWFAGEYDYNYDYTYDDYDDYGDDDFIEK